MDKDYSTLYDREIWTCEGPGGEFSLYRDNPRGLPDETYYVEKQVTATLASMGFPELYAAVGPADGHSFEPAWASLEEEESGEFPGSYNYEQMGIIWSHEDEAFSAEFTYLMQPMLVHVPEKDDLEDAVFQTDEECLLTIREW